VDDEGRETLGLRCWDLWVVVIKWNAVRNFKSVHEWALEVGDVVRRLCYIAYQGTKRSPSWIVVNS